MKSRFNHVLSTVCSELFGASKISNPKLILVILLVYPEANILRFVFAEARISESKNIAVL